MPHQLDKANMEWVIQNSYQQFEDGLKAVDQVAEQIKQLGTGFSRIVVAGMGGSAMPAALAQEARLVGLPISVHWSYGLPKGLNPQFTLVIASSFSGNTEETLSAYDVAREQGFRIIGVSNGGELERRCQADGVPFVKIPAADIPGTDKKMQPRSATGYGVGILVGILETLGLAKSGARQAVESLGPFLRDLGPQARAEAEKLVPKLKNATPAIYASYRFPNVARIWKIKFNENAKCPAFWNVFPELNHNEMTGWLHAPGPFHLVLLSDPAEDGRILLREKITREILKEKAGLDATVISMPGETDLQKMFGTLLIGDWASYLLALELGEDPSPVELVEDFKARLKQARTGGQ